MEMATNNEIEEVNVIKLKNRGNDHYKAGRFNEALICYTQAIECKPPDYEDKAALFRNRAAVNLVLENYEKAEKDATEALKFNPKDTKALYRRAQAREYMGNIQGAYDDATYARKLEPKNTAIQKTLEQLIPKHQRLIECNAISDREKKADKEAEQMEAFKISGSTVVSDDPLVAAINLLNFNYPGWQEFKAVEARFPLIPTPVISYAFSKPQLANTKPNITNKTKQDEAEINVFLRSLEAFNDSDLKPIGIHSLKGKMPEASEGFFIFRKIINDARHVCNVAYFNTKTKKGISVDPTILNHGEIGDVLLFGNAGIVVFEVKGDEVSAEVDLKADVEKAIKQLQQDESWLQNCWKVVEHYISVKKFNTPSDQMPPIHKFIVLPNYPRDMAVDKLNWQDSNIKLLCQEDIKSSGHTCNLSDYEVLHSELNQLLFATNISISGTYAHFIAMLCTSKAFRTYTTSYYHFAVPSGHRQVVSDLLFEQKFSPDGTGSSLAKFLTNHVTGPVTVFLTAEQQKYFYLNRTDLRGAPGTGKTLMIMLKILERSKICYPEDQDRLPILFLTVLTWVHDMYKIVLRINDIQCPTVDDKMTAKDVQETLVACMQRSEFRPVVFSLFQGREKFENFKSIKFDSIFLDEINPEKLLKNHDAKQFLTENAEIFWVSLVNNNICWNIPELRQSCDELGHQLNLAPSPLCKVMRYTEDQYKYLKTNKKLNAFGDTICGHSVRTVNFSREYQVDGMQFVDKVIELIEANKHRWVGETNAENTAHWERLAILNEEIGYTTDIMEEGLQKMGYPLTSKFGELGKLFVGEGIYSLEWPVTICIVSETPTINDKIVRTSRASTEVHIIWMKNEKLNKKITSAVTEIKKLQSGSFLQDLQNLQSLLREFQTVSRPANATALQEKIELFANQLDQLEVLMFKPADASTILDGRDEFVETEKKIYQTFDEMLNLGGSEHHNLIENLMQILQELWYRIQIDHSLSIHSAQLLIYESKLEKIQKLPERLYNAPYAISQLQFAISDCSSLQQHTKSSIFSLHSSLEKQREWKRFSEILKKFNELEQNFDLLQAQSVQTAERLCFMLICLQKAQEVDPIFAWLLEAKQKIGENLPESLADLKCMEEELEALKKMLEKQETELTQINIAVSKILDDPSCYHREKFLTYFQSCSTLVKILSDRLKQKLLDVNSTLTNQLESN